MKRYIIQGKANFFGIFEPGTIERNTILYYTILCYSSGSWEKKKKFVWKWKERMREEQSEERSSRYLFIHVWNVNEWNISRF